MEAMVLPHTPESGLSQSHNTNTINSHDHINHHQQQQQQSSLSSNPQTSSHSQSQQQELHRQQQTHHTSNHHTPSPPSQLQQASLSNQSSAYSKEVGKITTTHVDNTTVSEHLQFHQIHRSGSIKSPLADQASADHPTDNSPERFIFATPQYNTSVSEIDMHMNNAGGGSPFHTASHGPTTMMSSMDIASLNYDPQSQSPRLHGSFSENPSEFTPPDPTPRKRSKVSRACDECRRKKIRCDATSESGADQCSSCKRVGTKCSFSRVPMKRGPSKGYIKELADRLNTLENSISTGEMQSFAANGDGDMSPEPSDSTSPPSAMPLNSGAKLPRKRTLSSSSDFSTSLQHSGMHLQPLGLQQVPNQRTERLPSIDSFHSSQPQRQLPSPHPHTALHNFPKQQQAQLAQPATPVSVSSAPDVSSYRSQHSPGGANFFWKNDMHDIGRRTSGSSVHLDPMDVPRSSSLANINDNILDWDEAAIDQYYEIIHPTFPFLPHSKASLQARLASTTGKIRDALLLALKCTVRSNPSSTLRPSQPLDTRLAAEWTCSSQFESPSTRSVASNLMYLQTLIFLILEGDNHGPATIRGQMGPPKAVWLGAAIGMAYTLKLHRNDGRGRLTDGDPDSDEKLGQRAWWALVVLDRWHAISTSSPLMIPDSCVVLSSDDQVLLGLAPFHLSRLSIILGHLAETLTTTDEIVLGATSSSYVSKLLRGELERFRESVDNVWDSLNLVHLAYWHVKLLTLRHNATSEPSHLVGPALRIATILDSALTPVTPLNYHFAALAILTLVELAEIPETQQDAKKGINLITEALQKRRGISTREDSNSWDRAIKDLIQRRSKSRNSSGASTASSNQISVRGNLQHLAELAVGNRSPSPSAEGNVLYEHSRSTLDHKLLQKYGYLGCIGL